jgi:hypothetical protein
MIMMPVPMILVMILKDVSILHMSVMMITNVLMMDVIRILDATSIKLIVMIKMLVPMMTVTGKQDVHMKK